MEEPMIILEDSTVGQVCDLLHRDFRRNFRFANVWGKSARFPGQVVGINHKLLDEDILTIITR
jgi:ribosome-interacting GTPase 1